MLASIQDAVVGGVIVLLVQFAIAVMIRRHHVREIVHWWSVRALESLNVSIQTWSTAFDHWSTYVSELEGPTPMTAKCPVLPVHRISLTNIDALLVQYAMHLPRRVREYVLQTSALVEDLNRQSARLGEIGQQAGLQAHDIDSAVRGAKTVRDSCKRLFAFAASGLPAIEYVVEDAIFARWHGSLPPGSTVRA